MTFGIAVYTIASVQHYEFAHQITNNANVMRFKIQINAKYNLWQDFNCFQKRNKLKIRHRTLQRTKWRHRGSSFNIEMKTKLRLQLLPPAELTI